MDTINLQFTGTSNNVFENGKSYPISKSWMGWAYEEENYLNLSDFETPVQLFSRIVQPGSKIALSRPTTRLRVEILIHAGYICCYSHTKGNSYNIRGDHYKYYHDINTGAFVPEHLIGDTGPVLLKQRLLMKDYEQLIRKALSPLCS